jgi:dolichol-phosphate mannosyltransferase
VQTIVVVVPTYNERDNLPTLVKVLSDLRGEHAELAGLSLLVVDDGSPDGTGELADELAAESAGTIQVLHRTGVRGLGVAYKDGFAHALAMGADIVVQMDADLSHPASAIPAMVAALQPSDVGLVIGSRYVPGGATAEEWPLSRRLLSRFANVYVNGILRLGVHDATAGFKAWRASTLEAIDFSSTASSGYAFQVEMNFRVTRRGMRIAEVPIVFSERLEGTSKMNLRVQLESAAIPWKLRFQQGDRRWLSEHADRRQLVK